MISILSKPGAFRQFLIPFLISTSVSFFGFSQEFEAAKRAVAFPNPSNGVFSVRSEIPLDNLETILITDLGGRVIHGYTLETSPNMLKVDFHNHPAGEYIVHLIYKETSEHIRIEKID